MNLSTLFYIAGAVILYLVGFGLVDAAQGEVSLPWVALALGLTGATFQTLGDRRIG